MIMTRTRFRKLIRLGVFALAAAVVAGYAAWRSLAYVLGPEILINEPVDGASVASSTTEIIGRAWRVSSLYLNGRPITMDQEGHFNQTIIVFPGVNFLTVSATDRFGRSAGKTVEIYDIAPFPAASTTNSR